MERDMYSIHDLIQSGLRHDQDLWDILLAFQGTSIIAELNKQDIVTELYPFMTAAVANGRSLDFVYKIAMVGDPTILNKKQDIMGRGSRKRGREDIDN